MRNLQFLAFNIVAVKKLLFTIHKNVFAIRKHIFLQFKVSSAVLYKKKHQNGTQGENIS